MVPILNVCNSLPQSEEDALREKQGWLRSINATPVLHATCVCACVHVERMAASSYYDSCYFTALLTHRKLFFLLAIFHFSGKISATSYLGWRESNTTLYFI